MVDALPLRELCPPAFVVGEVLVAGILARTEASVIEGRRDGACGHPLRPTAHHLPTDVRVVDRLARRGRATQVLLRRTGLQYLEDLLHVGE
ncbi:hypothetical protein ACWD4O_42205 [Streptomyces sp. NPDC002623]